MSRFAAAAIVLLALAVPAVAQEELLGIPGPIVFEGTAFELAWTSHPSDTYYKQEYVPAGEAVESYDQMFMVDVLTEGQTPQDAAAAMIAGLDERKATDLAVNYHLIENEATGELILDFLLSDASRGTVIVEWNAYRYVPYGDGLALFAISRRAYGDEATPFLSGLKDWRQASIEALATIELPEIAIAH